MDASLPFLSKDNEDMVDPWFKTPKRSLFRSITSINVENENSFEVNSIKSSNLLSHWNHRKPLHPMKQNSALDSSPITNRSSSPLSLISKKHCILSKQSTLFQYFDQLSTINEEKIISDDCLHSNEQPCQLPYVETGKDALKRISTETMAELLQGNFDHLYDEKFIIDCRFPYEYKGGHIQSGININTMQELENLLLKNPIINRRVIIIFHCEFSSHRAPTMARHLRNQDRMLNYNQYPKLFYPEIYILKGGYKAFYNEFKPFCIPQNYIPMDDGNFKYELGREMTAFKKSWKRCKSFSYIPSEHDQL